MAYWAGVLTLNPIQSSVNTCLKDTRDQSSTSGGSLEDVGPLAQLVTGVPIANEED
jgi:hypothetical protein